MKSHQGTLTSRVNPGSAISVGVPFDGGLVQDPPSDFETQTEIDVQQSKETTEPDAALTSAQLYT